MLNTLVLGALILFFLLLSPALWLARKKLPTSDVFISLRNGLWGTWTYAAIVTVSFILGVLFTLVTDQLYVVYSLMVFAFPSGFSSSFGQCLLNGFDVYHPECDVFPGAFTTIFLLNSCLYFLVGIALGLVARHLKRR